MTPVRPSPGNGMIRYARLAQLYEDIAECCQLSQDTSEPHCMALEGRTGAGKTWWIRSYAAEFPRTEDEGGTQIPVFYAGLPSPATVKTSASRLLEALGDPAFEKGTLGGMTARLTRLIGACGVKLVILDDIHHLIAPDTDKVLEQVSHWLKTLIKDTGVPFLVIGIEGRVERVLRSNPELSRLFAVREKLEPFAWNVRDPNALEEFDHFVELAEGVVGGTLSPELERKEWLWRLHYASDGVVSYLIQLLRAALLRAGKERSMSRVLLEAAFAKRLAKIFPQKLNPFLEVYGPRFVPPKKRDPAARRSLQDTTE